MRPFLFALVLLSSAVQVIAQNFALGVNYGTYNMDMQKQLQNDFIEDSKDLVPLAIVDQFPAYIGYEGQITATMRNLRLGGYAGFNSTGGRLYYEDYSGKFSVDQLLQSYSAGAVLEGIPSDLNKNKDAKANFILTVRSGLSLNKFKLTSDFVMNQSTNNRRDQERFNSVNVTLTPGAGVRFNLDHFFVQAEARYLIEFATTMKFDSNGNTLHTNNGDGVSANWSGLRIVLLAGFSR